MKIKTIPTNTAEEPVATLYQSFLTKGLEVPVPLELITASPSLFNGYRQLLNHYFTHEALTPLLMACIRYTVAYRNRFNACIQMNRDILTLHGVTDITPLEKEIPLAQLNDADARIYHFAVDSLFYPERITDTLIAQLRVAGVTDTLMFDAAFHGALLLMMGPLVKAFC